jgi:hypothetical protein
MSASISLEAFRKEDFLVLRFELSNLEIGTGR